MNNIYSTLIILIVTLSIVYFYSLNKHKESFQIANINETFISSKNTEENIISEEESPKHHSNKKQNSTKNDKKNDIDHYNGKKGTLIYNYNIPNYSDISKYVVVKKANIDNDLIVQNITDTIGLDITITDPSKLGFIPKKTYLLEFSCKGNFKTLTTSQIRSVMSNSSNPFTVINNNIKSSKKNKMLKIQIQFTIENNNPLHISINGYMLITENNPFYIGDLQIYNFNKILNSIPINSNNIIFYLSTLLDNSFKKNKYIIDWTNLSDNTSKLYNQSQILNFHFDTPTSWNNSYGLIVKDNVLIGPDAHLLNLNQLTNLSIMWFMSANTMKNAQFLYIESCRSTTTGLEIIFNTDDKNQLNIIIKLKNNEYTYNITGYTNELLYILTIDGNNINLYVNGSNTPVSSSNIVDKNVSNVPIDITNKSLLVNQKKKCNLALYTLAMFNKSLYNIEITQIKKIYDIQFSYITDPTIFKSSLCNFVDKPSITSYMGISNNSNIIENNINSNTLNSYYDQNILGFTNNPANSKPYFIKNNKCKLSFSNKEDICYTYDINRENMNGDNLKKIGKCSKLPNQSEYTSKCCDIPLTNIQNKLCGVNNKCQGGEDVLNALETIDNIYSITYEKLPDGKIIKRIKKKNKKKCKKD